MLKGSSFLSFADLVAHIRRVVVEIHPRERGVDLGVHVAVLHIDVADAHRVVLQLVEHHFAVVAAPEPPHELMFFVGDGIVEAVGVKPVHAAVAQLFDDDGLSLVDDERHGHGAVFEVFGLHLDDRVDFPFMRQRVDNAFFGLFELFRIVQRPFFDLDDIFFRVFVVLFPAF